MAGFVDVSNMSALEIKRLGQMDDDVEDQPRQRRYGKYPSTPIVEYSVDNVWAAAVAAQRVNGAYYKENVYNWDDATQQQILVKRRNRDVMMSYLQDPSQLTAEDIQQGQNVRNFIQSDITFRGLKGKLTDFDSSASRVAAVTGVFNTAKHKLELATVACLPASAERSRARQESSNRISMAQGGYIGKPDDRVVANIEVLESSYSQKWNLYWIKGITDQDQPVFFSFKRGIDSGTRMSIQGNVKAHRDNLTQLNRVKIV